MKILSAEYNEYVVGYVIFTDKGDINAQFEKVPSNHPEPSFKLQIGCVGDDTADHLTDEERDQVSDYISENDEMRSLAQDFTEAYYNGSDLPELTAPISYCQISEKAKIDE